MKLPKLPKLYRLVRIRFWSLRNGLGSNGGVMFDCDQQVARVVRRVRTTDGWKWQIANLRKLQEWDWAAATDQEILDECRDKLEFEIVSHEEA